MKTQFVITIMLFAVLVKCTDKQEHAIPANAFSCRWQSQCTKCGGNPMMVKINRGLDSIVGKNSLGYQAAASVVLNHPLENGLPDSTDKKNLVKIEQVLVSRLVTSGLAVYGLEVQGNKRCDFIFYTDKKKQVHSEFEIIDSMITEYQIDFTVKRDDSWYSYRWYTSWK